MDVPLYIALREKLEWVIINGGVLEGARLPSVRQLAADEKVSSVTALRALELLADAGLVEVRRGVGMFVVDGARTHAREGACRRFVEQEWPPVQYRIHQLGLELADLLENELVVSCPKDVINEEGQ